MGNGKRRRQQAPRGDRAPAEPAPPSRRSLGPRKVQVIAGVGMAVAVAVAVTFSGPNHPASNGSSTTTGGDGGSASVIPTVPAGIPLAIKDGPVDPATLHGLAFTDVTKAAGVDLPQTSGALTKDGVFAFGASVVDYDGDGRPDIFLPRIDLPNALLHNDGDGTFTDVAVKAGLGGTNHGMGSSVGSWADVDGDGDPDVWLLSADGEPNRLYLNQGDGTFVDGTEAAGLATTPATDRIDALYGAAFGDFDRDGDLDLLSLHYNVAALDDAVPTEEGEIPPPCRTAASRRVDQSRAIAESQSHLYVNDGKGHFTDETAKLGLKLSPIVGFTPTWADYDDDGWPDLMITGDFCTSRVFHNDGGKGFTDVTAALGLGTDENGMGSSVQDINGDGRLDWFVTSISYPPGAKPGVHCDIVSFNNSGCTGNRLWLNEPGGKWKDVTDEYGVREGKWGWGAPAEDFDNDGDRDLLMVNGYRLGQRGPEGDKLRTYWDYFIEDQTRLWLNPGAPPFVQAAKAVGLTGGGLAKSAVPFDYDGDGDLDLLISHNETPPTLFRNDLPHDNRWIDVALHDTGSANTAALGARVSVWTTADSAPQVAEIRASGTYAGSTVPTVHFGLGPGVRTVAKVEVRWPDGTTTTTVRTDVGTDQRLVITRP